jgi:hypothetical protein
MCTLETEEVDLRLNLRFFHSVFFLDGYYGFLPFWDGRPLSGYGCTLSLPTAVTKEEGFNEAPEDIIWSSYEQ